MEDSGCSSFYNRQTLPKARLSPTRNDHDPEQPRSPYIYRTPPGRFPINDEDLKRHPASRTANEPSYERFAKAQQQHVQESHKALVANLGLEDTTRVHDLSEREEHPICTQMIRPVDLTQRAERHSARHRVALGEEYPVARLPNSNDQPDTDAYPDAWVETSQDHGEITEAGMSTLVASGTGGTPSMPDWERSSSLAERIRNWIPLVDLQPRHVPMEVYAPSLPDPDSRLPPSRPCAQLPRGDQRAQADVGRQALQEQREQSMFRRFWVAFLTRFPLILWTLVCFLWTGLFALWIYYVRTSTTKLAFDCYELKVQMHPSLLHSTTGSISLPLSHSNTTVSNQTVPALDVPSDVRIPQSFIKNHGLESVCILQPLVQETALFDTFLKRFLVGFACVGCALFIRWGIFAIHHKMLRNDATGRKRKVALRILVPLFAAIAGSAIVMGLSGGILNA